MELPKVVGKGNPFHSMVELAANPDPFTVRLNAAPPAWVITGLILLIVAATAGVTVNPALFDADPPVFTVTRNVPWEAIRLAAMFAIN